MRPGRLIAAALCLLATMGQHARGAPDERAGAAGSQGQPIITFTRQNAFTIPFRIEPPKTPSQQPVEVQLHVSTNQATTWELSSRVKPEKGAFVFRAPHDGEYWFSIRTVDKQGIARPESPLEPQLQVTVDTVAPRLDLSAFRGEAGEIIARWQAVDPHLKPESFKLEYQTDAAGPWERVAVEPPPGAMRHTLSSEATWWPKTAGDAITVRAEISDASGNPAVSQAIVKRSDTAGRGEAPRGAAGVPTLADRDAGDAKRWPADRSTSDPLARSTNPDSFDRDRSDRDSAWRGPRSLDAQRGPDRRVAAQPVSQNFRGPAKLDFSLLPRGQRPRMINSKSFELEYEIESVGPSGVGKVELWGTRDGGRTWSVFGVDPDKRSPISVNVDAEGIYGFRVVVQSGSGLGGRPPAAGDLPDIWIGVDLTKPTARISSAELDNETGELVIQWEASDEVPDARPVSLSFGPGPQGPWTPIASGLENTGSYRWRLDSRVNDKIFLKLEVRDEAGNLGAFETADPVALDRHRPEGRIRGVRPLGQ